MAFSRWQWAAGMAGVVLMTMACHPIPSEDLTPDGGAALDKITFDVNQLDEDGLYGPPDGKRSLDYEFCIPRESVYEAQVRAIDPSLMLYPDSPGRIGCTEDQVLAIGNTHQPNAVSILMELANLDFIGRIDRVDWE